MKRLRRMREANRYLPVGYRIGTLIIERGLLYILDGLLDLTNCLVWQIIVVGKDVLTNMIVSWCQGISRIAHK